MIRIHARVNVRDNSRTANIENTVRLSNADDLSRRLIHISVRNRSAVVVDRSVVPQTLRGGGGGGLIVYVRWNRQSLIGLRVENPIHELQHVREKLRQQSLRRPHQKYLARVSVQIAHDSAAVGKANVAQAQQAEVCPDDDTLLLILTSQHLADGRQQSAEESLSDRWLTPESHC